MEKKDISIQKTKENKLMYNIFLVYLAKLAIFLCYKIKLINNEIIPEEGPVILCGNHTHNFDSIFLPQSTNRVIHYLGKKELIDGKFGFFFKLFNIIPIDRKSNNKNRNNKAKNVAINELLQNRVLGIFPEGTINRTDDIIMSFKKGTVDFAYKTNAYVVPFAIIGNYKLFSEIKIIFGKPYKVKSNDGEIETKKLEQKVIKLLKGGKENEK